ncbi:MAG: TlpA family protein disulfide reductase [Lachnospiraceae bacterium]|nr:TlpA family protein disulfide reductase [Lachnospiraceae bacterium]
MEQDKAKGMHYSTLVLVGIAVVIGMIALEVSYVRAWGKREAIWDETSATDVFATVDTTLLFGGTFTKDDISKAKVTAVNVWETTCPACLGEMDELEELSKTYPVSEFQLVGVCADVYDRDGTLKEEQVEKGKQLMEDAGVTFPNMIPAPEMYTFFRSTIAGFPTTFFVDSEGRIIKSTCGARKLDDWKALAEEVMEEQK